MAGLRSCLALALLVIAVRCQNTTEGEEEEALFTERVPVEWLRPVLFIDEEEEETGFTERVPPSWLRPVPPPESPEAELTARNPPIVQASSSTAGVHDTTSMMSFGNPLGRTTVSSGGQDPQMSTVPLGLGNVEAANSPSTSPQEGATPPSTSAQKRTTLPSISAEVLKPTRAVPSSWQPDLPPPEIPEQDGGLEFREPPPQDGLWATPCRVSDMGARQIDSDTVLPDYGNFQLASGVRAEIASPRYPGKYPRYTWNTWRFSTRDADGTLHLSCDVIELGRGDFLVVRSDAGGRETFHSHVKSIETSAAGTMQVEFRSDRDDEGRLHCSVRAIAGVQSATGSATTQDGDKGGVLEKVDINYPDCGKTKFNTRIVGGSEPPPHSFPWLVALQTRRGKRQFCGGTVINERYIVTAAHCVDRRKPGGLSIAVAKHKRKNDPKQRIFEVKKITLHERYNRATQDRDIAIIELKRSLRSLIADKKGRVRPICLPQKTCRTENNCYMSRSGLVAGWGLLDSTFFEGPETVQYVKVPILSNSRCQMDYAKERIGITRRMMCAGLPDGGKDSCQGDSGGPLAVVSSEDIYTLAGIVSFGKGCALAGYPGVYVRVSELTDWIRTHSQL